MKLLHIAAGAMLLLSSSVNSFAGSVRLDYYSATGFASGPFAGQPVRFIVTMDGETGGIFGSFLEDLILEFDGIDTTALLRVGSTQIFSSAVRSAVDLGHGEGLDEILSTIAGVSTAMTTSSGLLALPRPYEAYPFFYYDAPSQIDQYLEVGIFFPSYNDNGIGSRLMSYDGQHAEITSLRVSLVPLPATFPLFTTGLGLIGLLGWHTKRKVAS